MCVCVCVYVCIQRVYNVYMNGDYILQSLIGLVVLSLSMQ